MIFWFLHSCLCVLLDVEDVRRRVDDPEAELLPLRHALRVVCRQVNGPAWTLQTGAIMAARSRLLTHPALGGLITPETILAWHREPVRREEYIHAGIDHQPIRLGGRRVADGCQPVSVTVALS